MKEELAKQNIEVRNEGNVYVHVDAVTETGEGH